MSRPTTCRSSWQVMARMKTSSRRRSSTWSPLNDLRLRGRLRPPRIFPLDFPSARPPRRAHSLQELPMTDDTETVPDACPPLSEWRTLDALRAQLEAELFKLNKGVLLDALASAGVTHVVVTFDGYGDSGQIENVEVRSGDYAIPMPERTIETAEALWGQSEAELSVNERSKLTRLQHLILTRLSDGKAPRRAALI